MKTITKLTGVIGESEYREALPHIHRVIDKTHPGYFRTAGVGSAGLVCSNGQVSVLIPTSELWALVESLVPDLGAPPDAQRLREVKLPQAKQVAAPNAPAARVGRTQTPRNP